MRASRSQHKDVVYVADTEPKKRDQCGVRENKKELKPARVSWNS